VKTLLVEDNADTSKLLAKGLEMEGCEVRTVSTVAAALDILINERFDVIVSDVGLPDGHGIGLIHGVRAFCDTPAIALTAFGSPSDVRRCLDAGFNAHLAKPSEISVIVGEMRRLVREHRRQIAPGNH
jgi:DNA-binding response OmpR family regulator